MTTPKTAPAKTAEPHLQHESLVVALAAFQAEIPTIRKSNTATVTPRDGKQSYKYDYADLSDVTEKALPLLGKHGLSFTARPTLLDGVFTLVYELRHESGDTDGGTYPLPDPVKTPPQQLGSAITYARRYILTSVTGIAPGGDDDDAGAVQQHQYQDRQPGRRQAAEPRRVTGAPASNWRERAEAASSPQELSELWQEARAAEVSVDVLDGIAGVGRRRQAEAQAALAASETSAAAPNAAEDADAAEAAAVAAHEAELAEAAAAQHEQVPA